MNGSDDEGSGGVEDEIMMLVATQAEERASAQGGGSPGDVARPRQGGAIFAATMPKPAGGLQCQPGRIKSQARLPAYRSLPDLAEAI